MAVPVTKAETESEWETDEDVIEAKPEEAKLEDALAKLDMLDLDSDDEKRQSVYTNKVAAKEEMKVVTAPTVVVEAPTAATTNGFENLRVPFGVVNPPQPPKTNGVHYKEEPEVAEEAKEEEAEEEEEEEEQKPTTFISEMIDIDDLLCKPSHFVAFDSPVAFEEEDEEAGSKTNSGDFSYTKPGSDEEEDQKTGVAKKSSMLDDHPWWEKGEGDAQEEAREEAAEEEDGDKEAVNEETKEEEVEESEWESEYEEAEEEEGEWEYYYDEEEAEDDDVKSTLDVATQKRTMSETAEDEKKEWIVRGLAQIIPMIPSRQQVRHPPLIGRERPYTGI